MMTGWWRSPIFVGLARDVGGTCAKQLLDMLREAGSVPAGDGDDEFQRSRSMQRHLSQRRRSSMSMTAMISKRRLPLERRMAGVTPW